MHYLLIVECLVNIEHMEKVFDNELGKMSQNQLAVLKCLLAQSERVWTTYAQAGGGNRFDGSNGA